jgi:putative peptidoglycan lipid II flippase
MLIALSAITAFFILAAGVIMPLFIPEPRRVDELTVLLSQVLFPVVLLLGLNGLLVGILQSYDRFTIAAVSPLVWNVVIIVADALLHPHSSSNHGIYAYAIAILAATVVQMLMAGRAARIDFRLSLRIDWHNPRVRQVFALMLPVTIGLGIVNLDQLINSVFGGLVNNHVPRAIDHAFRIYMLPQGMFSVAVATVLFPTLSRMAARARPGRDAARAGDRDAPDQPAADPGGGLFLMVLATPVVRLVYQRGKFNAPTRPTSQRLR